MKIIRTVWGDPEYVRTETEKKFIFGNEIVYVWGTTNADYLKSIGYEVILVSPDSYNPAYNRMTTKYYHKLETVILADSDFGEYVLIDWDTYPGRDLDKNFFDSLNKKSEIQCPLYSLPKTFFNEISKNRMPPEFLDFFSCQNKLIQKFSWDFKDSWVFPNFCFFYSRGAKIGNDLMRISTGENLLSNVEEFALFKWAGCTMEEYIKKHEPLVARGQINDSMPSVQKSLDTLNLEIDSMVDKIDYIKHK
jgi:hypothetical protein